MQDFIAVPHDTPNVRTYELENGNKLNLVRKDPYGFIYLHLEKGQLPHHLVGAAYTDWSQARKAAEGYMSQRQTAISELKDNPKKK